MSYDCDWDPAQVYHVEMRRAAKDHKCCECSGTIRKGENYEHVAGLWEGQWSTFHTCADCIPVRCEVARLPGSCGGWAHAGLAEELEAMRWQPANHRIIAMFNVSVAHRGGIQIHYEPEEVEA